MTKQEYEEERKKQAEVAGEIIGLMIERGETLHSAKRILNRALNRIENQERVYKEKAKIDEVYATRGFIDNNIMREF